MKMLKISSFLKTDNLKMIRIKLLALYLLNVADALLTHFMLSTGYFYEMNVLLTDIVTDAASFLGLKILVPGVLVLLLCVRLYHATDRQLQLGNIPINIVLFFYSLVNLNHMICIIYLSIRLNI